MSVCACFNTYVCIQGGTESFLSDFGSLILSIHWYFEHFVILSLAVVVLQRSASAVWQPSWSVSRMSAAYSDQAVLCKLEWYEWIHPCTLFTQDFPDIQTDVNSLVIKQCSKHHTSSTYCGIFMCVKLDMLCCKKSSSGLLLFVGSSAPQNHDNECQRRIAQIDVLPHWDRSCRSNLLSLPCHSLPILGQPVLALTLKHQAPGRVVAGVPKFKSLVWLDLGKRGSIPGSSARSNVHRGEEQLTKLVKNGLFVGCLTSQQSMRVYLRDGSTQTILHAATLRQKLQIKLSISPSHSILTPGQQSQHWPYNARHLAG